MDLVQAHKQRAGLELPHPVRSGVALAAIAPLPLILELAGEITLTAGLIVAGAFVATGLLRAALAYHELAALRRRADGELRRERRIPVSSPLTAWRTKELTSRRNRRVLARSLAHIELDLSPSRLPGASPLNRVAARPHVDLFRELSERLAALDRPVDPRGVLLVEDMLTSSESPLYSRERAGLLRAALIDCLDALSTAGERAASMTPRVAPANGYGALPANGKPRRTPAAQTTRHGAETVRGDL